MLYGKWRTQVQTLSDEKYIQELEEIVEEYDSLRMDFRRYFNNFKDIVGAAPEKYYMRRDAIGNPKIILEFACTEEETQHAMTLLKLSRNHESVRKLYGT